MRLANVQLIARDRPLFDTDAACVINRRLPLDTLRELVHRTVLPTHLRRELAMAVLTRSLILKEDDTTRDLVPVVKTLIPELGPRLTNIVPPSTETLECSLESL